MKNNLGTRIKQVRLFLNKSQDEFGRALGVSQSRQSRIEKGDADIPSSYLERLIDQYGEYINEDWLYMGKGIMQKSQTRESSETDYFAEFDDMDLSPTEAQILDVVKQFSEFLKTRDLNPHVKRTLLQLLIESIGQVKAQPRRDPDDS